MYSDRFAVDRLSRQADPAYEDQVSDICARQHKKAPN
jgi:hypothetical protein